MAFPIIAAGLAALGGVTGLIGQRSANKQAQQQAAEQARREREAYERKKLAYDTWLKRRAATLNFARAYAKTNGLDIPDSAFDMLLSQDMPFPGYSAPVKPYTPSSAVSGLLGAGTGFLQGLSINQAGGSTPKPLTTSPLSSRVDFTKLLRG